MGTRVHWASIESIGTTILSSNDDYLKEFGADEEDRSPDKLYLVIEGDIVHDQPIELDYFTIENSHFGILNCIIFRPTFLEVAVGRQYWVEVKGLQKCDGASTELCYLVEFLD